MPIGTYTPPLWKTITQKKISFFFILFFHFRCILLQISHKKCFFISISILGRSGVKRQAQSPLVGKVATTLRRRIIDPAARKLFPINNCESELDSDDDSCYERESIASEISHIEDKEIVTMDDFEGLQF